MSPSTKLEKAYEEIIDLIASGTNPDKLIAFQASEAVKTRVADLIEREKNEGITQEEKTELDLYLQLEHIMRLAKARASQYINYSNIAISSSDVRTGFFNPCRDVACNVSTF